MHIVVLMTNIVINLKPNQEVLIEKENMKRILTRWAIAFAALMLGTPASAEGGYFGIRGDGLIPIASNTAGGTSFVPVGIVLPLFGVQVGYDFTDQTEAGFSLRGTFKTVIIASEISLDALYRIPDLTGAAWYFGAGADMAFLLVISSQSTIFGAHAVVGYQFPGSSIGSFFLEAVPGLFGNSTGVGYYVSLAGGFNFRF
jgi:hypothetical protein